MPYSLSASKLQTYHRCPKSYHFRYELGLQGAAFFGSAALGTSLHQALAQVYRDWHYLSPLPEMEWINKCWEQNSSGLSTAQVEEGKGILHKYYHSYIANETAIAKPIAVEGKILGHLQVGNLEFNLVGRYDRLDWFEDGIELIDYKSTKENKLPESEEIDLQMGLYYLALEQRYQQGLKQLSLIFLRTGEKVSFRATQAQREQVQGMIGDIAVRLLNDDEWQTCPGKQCQRCTYARYCAAVQQKPEPLPENAKAVKSLQLALSL
jgi:putative RecB family exonuclease